MLGGDTKYCKDTRHSTAFSEHSHLHYHHAALSPAPPFPSPSGRGFWDAGTQEMMVWPSHGQRCRGRVSPCQPWGRSPAWPCLLLGLREESSCLPQPRRSAGLPARVRSARVCRRSVGTLGWDCTPAACAPTAAGGEEAVPLTFISGG